MRESRVSQGPSAIERTARQVQRADDEPMKWSTQKQTALDEIEMNLTSAYRASDWLTGLLDTCNFIQCR